MSALRSAERYLSLTHPTPPSYNPAPAVHPDRMRALAALAWMDAYGRAMAEAEVPPNGDDFNDLMDGVGAILRGGRAPRIVITHAGR